MNIKIVCVGNVKESYFREALEEYYKRLSRFVSLKVVEVKEEKISKNPNIAEINNVIEKESERLISQFEGYVILCNPEGRTYKSEDFAKNIKKIEAINSTITFVIGGSYGVSERLKILANINISFGTLTYPHQLFRVMLAEQIYRAYTIINNITYHK